MRERFGARKAKSLMLRFHTQTGGSTLTAQQPDNNIVRVAIQTLAAVLGGTQSLHTNSRDEALALPSEHAVRIALRTQQIVANESGVANVVDPLAGSYFVEDMTDRIETEARDYISKIDSLGGMVQAVEEGYPQRQIQDAAYTYQREIESSERIVVGVNSFVVEELPPEGLLRVDPSVEKAQFTKLKDIRSNRDNGAVAGCMKSLELAANSSENLMPSILEAVRSYATLGEICGVLREAFGEYRPNTVL